MKEGSTIFFSFLSSWDSSFAWANVLSLKNVANNWSNFVYFSVNPSSASSINKGHCSSSTLGAKNPDPLYLVGII